MITIHVGDCRETLGRLAANSVNLVITSPPFYGLRAYKVEPGVWGGTENCEHVWGDKRVISSQPQRDSPGGFHNSTSRGKQPNTKGKAFSISTGQFCQLCHTWRGTLGNEPHIELYVQNLVGIFRHIRRVLHPTGCAILNLGDSFISQGGPEPAQTKWQVDGASNTQNQGKSRRPSSELKAKDLAGIPWTVALALRDDGWWLRSEIPWLKRNPMPGSQTDRPTTAHEHIFLLAKSARYYWDGEAIRQTQKTDTYRRMSQPFKGQDELVRTGSWGVDNLAGMKSVNPSGRTYRTTDPWFASLDALIDQQREYLAHLESIRADGGLLLNEDGEPLALQVNTRGSGLAHFAVFPPDLVLPFVKAGSSERGVCGECRASWVRVTRRTGGSPTTKRARMAAGGQRDADFFPASSDGHNKDYPVRDGKIAQFSTLGWRPTCPHYPRTDEWRKVPRQLKDEPDEDYQAHIAPIVQLRGELLALWKPMKTERAVVLDPFGGAGTTAMVADREQRDAVLCELSSEYTEMGRERLQNDGGMFTTVEVIE